MKTLLIIGLILTIAAQIWLVIELCTLKRNEGYHQCKTEIQKKFNDSSSNFSIL